MSKKRQDYELELRKLDLDRRDADVRIRSIEQSPRNKRILSGDFSRPPPREGDTRRFQRGRGFTSREEADEEEQGEQATKRQRVEEEDSKKEDKEEKEEEPDKDEADVPSVMSAVVVSSEDAEAQKEGDEGSSRSGSSARNADASSRGARPDRKRKGTEETKKRDRRMFGALLFGHLSKASARLKKDKETDTIKKKEELEAKVTEKLSQRTVDIREKEAEQLAQRLVSEKKTRDDIIRKEEAKRRELDELVMLEHEELLGNFIRTQTEPPIYYLPASHTEKTKKLLAKTKEIHEARVASGGLLLEKDLDQQYIEELFTKSEEAQKDGDEEPQKEDQDKDKKQEDGDKPSGGKDGDKEKAGSKHSSSKKKDRKKSTSDSSSESDSSD